MIAQHADAASPREWDFVTPGGLRLAVCEWGPAEGLPVVILHGYLEQGASWGIVAPHLGRRVVAPDMRGHGRSGHVGPGGFYHFWDYVPDVLALIAHLGGRVDLVGHSMGASLAVLVAGVRPEAVRRLALVDGIGPPDGEDEEVPRALAFVAALDNPPRHTLLADLDDAVRRLRRYDEHLPPDFARFLASRVTRPARPDDAYDGAWRDGGLIWTWDALHRARAPYPFRAAPFRKFLARIAVPTLYLEAALPWYSVPDRDERLAALRDVRRVVVDGAGHMIHHDRPEALAAHLTAFFDGAP